MSYNSKFENFGLMVVIIVATILAQYASWLAICILSMVVAFFANLRNPMRKHRVVLPAFLLGSVTCSVCTTLLKHPGGLDALWKNFNLLGACLTLFAVLFSYILGIHLEHKLVRPARPSSRSTLTVKEPII